MPEENFTCPPIERVPGHTPAEPDTHAGSAVAAAARGRRVGLPSARKRRSTAPLAGRGWGLPTGFLAGESLYPRMGDNSSRDCFTCLRRSANVMALGGFGRSAAVRALSCSVAAGVEAGCSGRAQAGTTPIVAIMARTSRAMTDLRDLFRTVHPWRDGCERSAGLILDQEAWEVTCSLQLWLDLQPLPGPIWCRAPGRMGAQ